MRWAEVGIPSGWVGESFGRRAAYEFTIEQNAARRVLHLESRDEHSTIARDITGQVNLKRTPILEWTWKAAVLPMGGDLRRKETTDMAAQLYVVWPRFPELLRSRIIGYVWDATTPVATIAKSQGNHLETLDISEGRGPVAERRLILVKSLSLLPVSAEREVGLLEKHPWYANQWQASLQDVPIAESRPCAVHAGGQMARRYSRAGQNSNSVVLSPHSFFISSYERRCNLSARFRKGLCDSWWGCNKPSSMGGTASGMI
jgi:hypothetical protein